MPLWFLLSLGAVVLWAVVNLVDKYLVVDNESTEYPIGSLVLFSSLVGVIVCAVIPFFVSGIFDIALSDKLILMFAGVADIGWIILYLYALKYGDASSVVPWFLTIPVFSYFLGFFLLGETLTSQQLFGGLIICLGALLISIDYPLTRGRTKIKWKMVMYMLPAALLSALWGVLFKFGAEDAGYWVSSFWQYVGLGISGILLALFVRKYRSGFVTIIKKGGRKMLTLNITSETVTIIGNLMTNYAILMVPVTLVYLVGTFQPIVVLVLTVIMTKFAPKIIKEDLSRAVMLPKIVAISIMVAGSIFLFQ